MDIFPHQLLFYAIILNDDNIPLYGQKNIYVINFLLNIGLFFPLCFFDTLSNTEVSVFKTAYHIQQLCFSVDIGTFKIRTKVIDAAFKISDQHSGMNSLWNEYINKKINVNLLLYPENLP